METIKVNMNPNPLDVQTIHASQNDGEARQWEFELHNNGELIDTSDVKEQLVFKAYKGGTEQLLPENGSTPTTSPFKGDIKYPQGLLTDQEFTYRQSPTESDGLAFIEDIKGNTLVWNQIFIPQYRTQSGIQSNVIQDGNDYSVRIWGTSTTNAWLRMDATGTLPVGHKFLLDKGSTSNLFDINNDNNGLNVDFSAKSKIGTVTIADKYIYIYVKWGTTIDVTVKPILIDLTKMFGEGNEPSTVEEFTSLFPLSYYSYNQGSLLSFNGNGIKTTGKNLLKTNISSETINGVTFTVNKDENGELTEIIVSGTATQRANLYVLPQGTNNVLSTGRYILSAGFNSQNIYMSSYNATTELSYRDYGSGVEVPYVTGEDYSIYISVLAGATANNFVFKPMLRLIDVEDSTFEPYTSSTLSLPISTYFPSGMDGVGTAYDELTNTKAIKRMARLDLGTLSYSYESTQNFFYATISDIVGGMTSSTVPNVIIPGYSFKGETVGWTDMGNLTYGFAGKQIRIRNNSYTTVDSFKQAVNGTEIVYPLATPTETSFTTASLVTENAEIPLSNEDGVLIGKCTEQLSNESGFFDAKIKLADDDGECYSNKIQLHVERSPQ